MPISQRRTKVIGFLLAAGYSRRFGRDKRRARIADGRTVLQASADWLSPVCDRLMIATRPDDDLSDIIQPLPHWTLCPVLVDNAGMGDSLSTLSRLCKQQLVQSEQISPTEDARDIPSTVILVALGDMPFIQTDTALALVQTFQTASALCKAGVQRTEGRSAAENALRTCEPIVLPRYEGRRGHPVLFSAGMLDTLMHCQGDTGARHVLHQHSACVLEIDTTDAGVVADIDLPEHIYFARTLPT